MGGTMMRPRVSRREAIKASVAAVGGAALLSRWGGMAEGARRPNIIFILADDLGWAIWDATGRS
jgi:hypothetical protein